MTSNIGSDIIQANFERLDEEKDLDSIVEATKAEVLERLKQTVRPEFLNRIDEIVMFHPLLRKQIRQIVELQLSNLHNLLAQREIDLEFSKEALDFLGEEGYDPQYGARPLKRVIQKDIVNALSKKILAGEIDKGSHVKVDAFEGEGLVFVIEKNASAVSEN